MSVVDGSRGDRFGCWLSRAVRENPDSVEEEAAVFEFLAVDGNGPADLKRDRTAILIRRRAIEVSGAEDWFAGQSRDRNDDSFPDTGLGDEILQLIELVECVLRSVRIEIADAHENVDPLDMTELADQLQVRRLSQTEKAIQFIGVQRDLHVARLVHVAEFRSGGFR